MDCLLEDNSVLRMSYKSVAHINCLAGYLRGPTRYVKFHKQVTCTVTGDPPCRCGGFHVFGAFLARQSLAGETIASVMWLSRMFLLSGYLPWQQMCLAGFSPPHPALPWWLQQRGWASRPPACACALLTLLRGHISWAQGKGLGSKPCKSPQSSLRAQRLWRANEKVLTEGLG